MALRVLLVALVAAMGLEPPDSAALAKWDRSARGWVADRMAELSSLAGDEVPAGLSNEATPGRVDLAFEAASEAMASGFSTDLASIRSKPVEAPAEFMPEVAVEDAPTPRTERVSEAVRLTRQAVDAWASLIRPTADHPVGDVESGDSL